MRIAQSLAAVALLAGLVTTAEAYAQTADVSRFRTPITARGGIGIEGAQTLTPGSLAAGLLLDYAHNPVVWRYSFGAYEPVLEHQYILDATFAVGIVHGIDVGVVLPLVLTQNGPTGAGLGDLSASGIGDIRLVPRVALTNENEWGFSSAFVPEFTLPTGNDARFTGDPGFSFRPRLVASVPFSFLRFNGSLAYRARKNADIRPDGVGPATAARQGVDVGNEIEFQFGIDAEVADAPIPVYVLAELSGYTSAAHAFSGDGLFGLEVLGGARARFADLVDVTAGIGAGTSQGIGTPMWRGILAVNIQRSDSDRDHDGIPDRVDACPDDPEDMDGHDDLDGCPDPDNDGDGIVDQKDRCPNEPETVNGIADKDGCPDGLITDKDGDGIPDNVDKCPLDPEDIDGFNDEDGCPDPDNDRDGIVDELDQCPSERETINGVNDYDGCPDDGAGATEYVENERILINQTVNFETGKSIIKEDSKSLLDQVALQILAHDEIKSIRVEGHTDSVGPDEDNLILSQDRADSVRRYLINRGVPSDKLLATGYGETKPIDTNNTSAGRARNRRVEFVIIENPSEQ